MTAPRSSSPNAKPQALWRRSPRNGDLDGIIGFGFGLDHRALYVFEKVIGFYEGFIRTSV